MSTNMLNYIRTKKQSVPIKLMVIYLLSHAMAASGLRFTSLSHKITPKEYDYDRDSYYVSPGLFYGSCIIHPDHENKDYCTFVTETTSNVDSMEHLRFCNVTLDAYVDSKYGNLKGYHFIHGLDENTAAISTIFYASKHKILTILHFSDCRAVPINIDAMGLALMAPLDGVFDVVWTRTGKESFHYNRFRTVMDFEGNVIEETRDDWVLDDISHVYSYAVFRSPLKGRLVVLHAWLDGFNQDNGGVIRLMSVSDDGSTKIIKEYPIDKNTGSWYKKYVISYSHQLLSICAENNSLVRCGQFDMNGVLKFETNITLWKSKSSNEEYFKAYNLPGGGLLLAIFRCLEYYSDACIKQATDYFVVKKFDDTGRQVGSLQIWPSQHNYKFEEFGLHFFVNEKKEMCLSSLNFEKRGEVNLFITCFKDDDFIM